MSDDKNNIQMVQAEVNSSMKDDFKASWQRNGFRSEAEAIRYLIRQYILNGIQSQPKSSPEAVV